MPRKKHEIDWTEPYWARILTAWRGRTFRPAEPEALAAYKGFVSRAKTAKHLRCYWCKKRTKRGRNRCIDHIQPVTEGGTNCIFNLCIACRRCNAKKYNKLPIYFCGQGELHFW